MAALQIAAETETLPDSSTTNCDRRQSIFVISNVRLGRALQMGTSRFEESAAEIPAAIFWYLSRHMEMIRVLPKGIAVEGVFSARYGAIKREMNYKMRSDGIQGKKETEKPLDPLGKSSY